MSHGTFSATADRLPRRVVICSDCFSARQNQSICQRCLCPAAMVAEAKFQMVRQETVVSRLSSTQRSPHQWRRPGLLQHRPQNHWNLPLLDDAVLDVVLS